MTTPHPLELCQAAVLPQRRRKRSSARVADGVGGKTAAANATDEEKKGGEHQYKGHMRSSLA